MKETFEAILPKLEGAKTRIKYRSSVDLGNVLWRKIVPYFADKGVYYIVYSELKCRKLFKIVNKTEIDRSAFDKIGIIKIGSRGQTPFGKLIKLIPDNDDMEELFENIELMIPVVIGKVVVLCGFDLFIALEGKAAVKKLKKFYESLGETTIFFTCRNGILDEITDRILEDFHDNNFTIERQEFSESNVISVEESVLDVPSYILF